MTQSNLLELAKQGNVEAIADVISYFMQPQGVTAKAVLKDNCLEVIIEASQVPEQQQSVTQISKLINHLQIGLRKVVVYAKQKGTNSLVWHQDFEPAKVDSPLPESITKDIDTEQVDIWEKTLETVIEHTIGGDFSQDTVKKFIDELYLKNPKISREEICQTIINQKSIHSGLFGAVTGIGGLAVLPIALPANLYTSWKIQAATIRAIAYVYGHPPSKTDTFLVLFGGVYSKMKALKSLGIEVAKVVTKKAVDQYITKEIGKALWKLAIREIATKLAQKALITKMIPLIGAPIGFSADWLTTQAVGKFAIKYYSGR